MNALLRWYGQVSRSAQKSFAKWATLMSPSGMRYRGSPKKQWMNSLRENMQTIGDTSENAELNH